MLLLLLLFELDDIADDAADIGDIPRNAGIVESPDMAGISGNAGMAVSPGKADIPAVSDDISVPSSMLFFLKAELDEDEDEEEKEADLLEEEEDAAILLRAPVAAKSPEEVADSLLEAKLLDELLEAAAMALDPSGDTYFELVLAASAVDLSAAIELDFPSAETAAAVISFSDFSYWALSLPSADSSVLLPALRLPVTSAPPSFFAKDLLTVKSPSLEAASSSRSYHDF